MSTGSSTVMITAELFDGHKSVTLLLPMLKPLYLVRASLLACTVAITMARLSPPLRQRFLAYGARAQSAKKDKKNVGGFQLLSKLLDLAASVDVPHKWFAHFYLLSLASSSCWMLWFLLLNTDECYVCHDAPGSSPSQSYGSTLLCLSLMLAQGARRLIECVKFSKSSTSRMWIGHYAFGLFFYLITNVAIWIENTCPGCPASSTATSLLRVPSRATIVGFALFILASYVQSISHAYLARLRKYSLPEHWLFRRLVAPHYTAECAIYFSLAIVGAPDSTPLNFSLLCVAILTAVNLGVTAEGTKSWMLDKFGDRRDEIRMRWNLIPGLW